MNLKIVPILIAAAALLPADNSQPDKQDLFIGGEGGYTVYRIPALVVTNKGTLLAFCAARKEQRDWADIDIALRRSTDGNTWEPMRVVAESGTLTVDNPTPIVDQQTGSIHLLYQINYERMMYMRSDDDGKTFSTPADITSVVAPYKQKYPWTVIAPGPGHGIQLRNGRLLAGLWMSPDHSHRPSMIATVYSDDHGKTWKAGEILRGQLRNPSENMPVELNDGRIMLNIRSESTEHRRALSYSKDGASGWTIPGFHNDLFEPVCMASILSARNGKKRLLVFSNPYPPQPETASAQHNMNVRENLTVRTSEDDGKTWKTAKLLESGRTGYSDLAQGKDGSIWCLYERGAGAGNKVGSKDLRIARMSLASLGK